MVRARTRAANLNRSNEEVSSRSNARLATTQFNRNHGVCVCVCVVLAVANRRQHGGDACPRDHPKSHSPPKRRAWRAFNCNLLRAFVGRMRARSRESSRFLHRTSREQQRTIPPGSSVSRAFLSSEDRRRDEQRNRVTSRVHGVAVPPLLARHTALISSLPFEQCNRL